MTANFNTNVYITCISGGGMYIGFHEDELEGVMLLYWRRGMWVSLKERTPPAYCSSGERKVECWCKCRSLPLLDQGSSDPCLLQGVG
ncbi:hypothetical protein CsSME_00014870 [Camellia sinensis var. sinensis]